MNVGSGGIAVDIQLGAKVSVYMKDWFGGRNDMLHYLRTGELQGQLQHRPGEMGRGGQGDDGGGAFKKLLTSLPASYNFSQSLQS